MENPKRNTVFTIGHSTREFDEVMEMLRENGVTTLMDVRSLPGSRRYPQWDRENIEAEIPEDIGYQWAQKLGGRRYTPVGQPSSNTAWKVKAFKDYADYMATEEFAEGLDTLLDLAEDEVVAIMCSEAVPWRCHRRLITDALLTKGVEVKNIMGLGSVREASMTPFAEVTETGVIYPSPA